MTSDVQEFKFLPVLESGLCLETRRKIMAHPTLQDILKLVVPEGAMHHMISRDLMTKQM